MYRCVCGCGGVWFHLEYAAWLLWNHIILVYSCETSKADLKNWSIRSPQTVANDELGGNNRRKSWSERPRTRRLVVFHLRLETCLSKSWAIGNRASATSYHEPWELKQFNHTRTWRFHVIAHHQKAVKRMAGKVAPCPPQMTCRDRTQKNSNRYHI